MRDAKQSAYKEEIATLKRDLKTTREGYVKKTMQARFDFLTMALATIPENQHLTRLDAECEKEQELVENEVFEASSSESSTDSEIDDEDARAAKREERFQRKAQEIAEGKEHTSREDILRQEIPSLAPRNIFEQIYESTRLSAKKYRDKFKPSKHAPVGSLQYKYRRFQANRYECTALSVRPGAPSYSL